MADITREQLLALLATMPEEVDDSDSDNAPRGTQFASLGFVAIGTGSDPGEGTVIQVPTKAGKLNRVRTIHRIDLAPFGVSAEHDWAYTYTKLKRGE